MHRPYGTLVDAESGEELGPATAFQVRFAENNHLEAFRVDSLGQPWMPGSQSGMKLVRLRDVPADAYARAMAEIGRSVPGADEEHEPKEHPRARRVILAVLIGLAAVWLLAAIYSVGVAIIHSFDDGGGHSTYWYCWDTGDPSPHHLGHNVSGDHRCSNAELKESGTGP